VRFQNTDEIDIVVDVPEGFMAADSRGATIQQSFAELSTLPGRRFPVHLKEVAQIADPRTQIFPARFAMKASPGITALPSMTANVTVTSRSAPSSGKRILVPIEAISRQETGEQVVWRSAGTKRSITSR
jgi:multidrug efflux pump subunit AcrA (membrane-fusion protein)